MPVIAVADSYWGAEERLFDNLSMFIGLDGSKQPQDFGVNAQFGGRASVNWGIPLFEAFGLGAQIGTAIDATGDAVQVVQRLYGSSGRTQSFTTLGAFQRTEMGLSWDWPMTSCTRITTTGSVWDNGDLTSAIRYRGGIRLASGPTSPRRATGGCFMIFQSGSRPSRRPTPTSSMSGTTACKRLSGAFGQQIYCARRRGDKRRRPSSPA